MERAPLLHAAVARLDELALVRVARVDNSFSCDNGAVMILSVGVGLIQACQLAADGVIEWFRDLACKP